MKNMQTLMLLMRCFARALFAGKASRVPKNPKKICIIQRAKLGDMVCTTPMFAAIKKQYPKAEVWVVGDEVNRQLLDRHPAVDGYIVWERDDPTVTKELRAHMFDFLCITAPSAEALASAYLAGVPCIVVPIIEGGWSPYETRSYKLLRSLVLTRPHTMGQYAPREYLRLLEPLDIIAGDTTKTLGFSKEARVAAEQFIEQWAGARVVGIAPSAGNKIKTWPAERFAAVADYVVEKYRAHVVLFGGEKDRQEVEEVLRLIKHRDHIHSSLGQFSIDELKAVIGKLSLFISGDTGPIYIAEAFTVATVDIAGPVDEREQPPMGPRHIVITPERAAPQLHVMNARIHNAAEVQRQAHSTTVAEVTQAIDALLASGGILL